MAINWQEMFIPATPLLECFLRGSIIYLSIFFIFRFIMPRVGGSLSMGDVLVVVLIADGVQNGMAGEIKSITEALVVAGAIVFWDYAIEWTSFHVKAVRNFFEQPAILIVKDGMLLNGNMKRQLLSEDELKSKMRLSGIEALDKIREAYLENDGHISFITK